ncbi:MAG: cell wall-binding repeat-containing protein [Finegoldia magna]|nr:cell wall-binding repeat-containing protein [Finegoldia magna]
MRHSIRKEIRRFLCFLMTFIMILTSMPVHLLAAANVDHNNLSKSKNEIINNKTPVMVAKPEAGKTAEDLIKNPDQPDIYTLRTDYKVQRGDKYHVDYQPYIASVGGAATQAEKDKVKKTINLPDIAGYEKPQDDYTIDYDTIKNAADGKGKAGDKTKGIRYQANEDFRYKAKANEIKIKHVFQDLEDFSKYTNPDGSVGDENALFTTQSGNTGSTTEVSPLDKNDPRAKGFVPEANSITMQVPENAENFILEYRYNRAHFDVVFDTQGGTEIPARTLYYGQAMPKIADESIPTKVGGEFQGWKPSVDLTTKGGQTFKANEIIKVGTNEASKNLDANLIMPASKVTFTAVWKDKDKADYAVQFWAEKSDHADGAELLDKYDYIGTRVYKDKDTGSRPDLANEPVKDIVFPDLDQARLNKIWANARFNRGKDLYLNKFYVYNQALTHDQNKDPKNVNLVKSVDSTGKTVYNIYYDRQVYELYFTKSNQLPAENTFYPEIWGYDEEQGVAVKKGGPGNLYHYKARFNQLMLGWPNDAMQTKGFSEGMQSFGWGPNYSRPNWPVHLDTPPYRLNADEFLDMPNYDTWGGYTKKIDKGDGTNIKLDWSDFKTLSFGIKQDKNSMPHHMDFWMDGFKDDETIIRYDLYRFKADTNSDSYAPSYPKVQGFTGKRTNETPEYLNSDGIDDKNDKRADVTPFPDKTYTDMYGNEKTVGQMQFIKAFFNNADDWGDPDGWDGFDTNGYLKFEYKRNKYPLRFNYDPSKIKGDNEFNSTNQLQTFYEFPLKALSPDLEGNKEYKKDNPANLLDNPEKLQELELTDLVFTDPKDGKLKVKRPDNLSDQMVFKGWALDPAGTKLIWENPGEKMPNHPVNLYAKWGEPDYQWKVTFDPNGGSLNNIKEEDLTTSRKKIQEGDIGQEETKTYAKKEKNDGNKQVFTVIQRQKLVEPKYKPTRKGYDFMGWEVIRYKKDAITGDYTDEIDNSYRETYKVPELYSFGNDVVAPVYLKAIWVPNARVDVKVEHYMLDKDYKLKKILEDTLEDKRANYLVATTGDKQDDEYILATHKELEENLKDYKDQDGKEYKLKTEYDAYNERVKADNTFFQQFRVEPAQILNTETNKLEDNPDVKNNVFKFFYKPFRTRQYKVNYIDERFKGKETQEGAAIIDQELVENGNRHYDARNYRPIPGWVLAKDEKPQQQLFFDVNEDTNEFLGINGTKSDEITFYYKDVRVIEVKDPKEEVPDGYVRVTFKADKGGSFGKDAQGKDITEIHYDVIKGLKSDLLPVPKELAEGKTKEEGKYYITPDDGRKFTKWDKSPLLNANTIINENHTFTAYFEWSGLSATGLVRTEAFKDDKADAKKDWSNKFAPTIEQLKAQLVWREKDQVKDLPDGTEIKLYDEAGNELTKDDQVYKLVTEKKAADKDELVRTVNVKAKVTFKDGKDPQELDIPITVYKNVYEALNKEGDKPLFLKEAEEKEAKDGGLKDVTGNYVKVTIQPTEKNTNKDAKVYYVNPKAWVNIPEVAWSKDDKDKTDFLSWTADKNAQNEKDEEGNQTSVFDFSKRHKFTDKETLIKPLFTKEVVEQKDKDKKPDVPDNYVKVIVKTTDKATDETKFEKTFWVNPTKEVTIDVKNPTGKTVAADTTKPGTVGYTMNFFNWTSEEKTSPRTWKDKIVGKFEKETTIVAKYSVEFEKIKDLNPKTDTVPTPQGKIPTVDEITKKLTPPEGKTIKEVKIVENPDVNNPGKSIAKVIVEYTDGSSVGTKDKPVEVPVEVHKNIIPEAPGGQKPKDALDNYVKVIFKAGTGGSVSGDLVYYVSPEVEVDLTESAGKVTKTPDIGYFVNGEKWTNTANKTLKGTFTDKETEFVFEFGKSDNIVEKTDDPSQVIPKGYVKVTFKTDGNGKVNDADEKIYYVNPKAGITLKVLGENETATDKQLAVPKPKANDKFTFKEWQENIDEATPITSERTHVAIFKSGQVTLTYEKGGADVTGEVPAAVTVNVGTTVRLAGKGTLDKPNATFAGWKLDGEDKIYQPGDQVTLEKARTATAQWTNDKNIIPYDPKEPITRPDGYVRVTFEADEGLTLSKVKYYYVKKNSGVTLEKLAKPDVKSKVGFKFKNWDKDDLLEIKDKDVVVTAQPTPIEDVIEGKPGVKKPDGYVKVTFKADDSGNGTVTETVYFVNPNKYVNLTAPTDAKGKTGFEFGAWSENLSNFKQYKEDTVITASFNPVDSVIPKTNDGQQKPDGYVTVNFVIEGKGGQIVDGETITYFVNPNEEVTIQPPKIKAETGYVFEKWDPDTTTKAKYEKDTTVTGNFKKLDDIISSTDKNGKPNAQPVGYVTVTFDKGANGSLTGQTSYYVNPNAGKKLSDITKPEVKPETGFKFNGWDTKDDFAIKDNKTVVAKYEAIADVIPKTKQDDSEKPAGYIKVTFDTTEKGNIKGTTNTTKVVFVNPNKAVVLKGFAPEVVANKGHEFERWDTSIEKPIQYKNGDTIKAIYKDDNTPGGTTPGGTTPGDKPGDKPGDNPGGTTPGDKPGDKPGDNPGGTTPGGTTPGTNPETPGENPETPGTVPENPGAIPGTKPGEVEKHGNRYVERVAGKNRVHTAINTSNRFFKKSKYVIIADSGNYPDALTATVLAHVLDAPILLNNTRYLEDDVAREIVRLGASEVIIVGGHKSISENVKSQLAKYDANKVQRIWGRDRYVTSSELAYEIERLTGKVNKAIIASGENFPDALATAPLGSKEIAPILLVTRNQMDKKVSKALKDLNIKRVYVAGGQNSVSKKLEAQLPQVIRRFSGQDRYETAILVASYTYPESKEVFVASGETFPDALVIGPVCARRKAPILLSKSTPVKVTDDYIEKSKIEYLYIIGGTNTIYADTAHKYAIED